MSKKRFQLKAQKRFRHEKKFRKIYSWSFQSKSSTASDISSLYTIRHTCARNRHVPNPRSQQCHKTRPVKTLSPIVRNIVMTDGIRNHLSCQPTSANALGPCRKFHACHANEEVSDGLHLPRKTTFQTSKVSWMPHVCHEKLT